MGVVVTAKTVEVKVRKRAVSKVIETSFFILLRLSGSMNNSDRGGGAGLFSINGGHGKSIFTGDQINRGGKITVSIGDRKNIIAFGNDGDVSIGFGSAFKINLGIRNYGVVLGGD